MQSYARKWFSGLLMVLLAVSLWASPASARDWRGRVVNILDGETLLIKQHGGRLHRVRLYGVAAPKPGQYFAINSRDFLWHLVYGHTVLVIPVTLDGHGRIVALLTLHGQVINKEMVRTGRARFYHHSCREEPFCGELRELERASRFQRRGLWGPPPPPPPEPPPWWYWRRRW